jgi:hypothetical protein
MRYLIAGLRLQRIIKRGVDQFDDGAGVFADRLQREPLQRGIQNQGFRAAIEHAVDGAGGFLMLRQVGGNVRGMDQAALERPADKFLRPWREGGVKRVGEHQQQGAVGFTERQALTRDGVVEGHDVECRLQAVQALHVEHRIAHGPPKPAHEGLRVGAQPFFQQPHQSQRSALDLGAHLLNEGQRDSFRAEIGLRHVVHWMLPASSKMGRYISSTMSPMTTPMKAISSGSNRRVNQSTQRAMSSS